MTGSASEGASNGGAPQGHPLLLAGKNFLVTGAANSRSIAWAVAKAVGREGGSVALTYQSERLKRRVSQLADELGGVPMIELDAASDAAVKRALDEVREHMPVLDGFVHSIAWAPAEDLQGSFVDTTRAGFAQANDISSYSLIATAREARRLMTRGGAIVTMTYAGSWRVVPNYNVMGPAKASLESAVRYLAADLGPEGIRVNAVSAGPIATVAARTIKDFSGMLELLESHAPLRRNVTSDEVADATIFLLSDLSRAITGEVVHVDAGAHATI
jgi:enoyl-[acyl-carrier protein] reductase I